MWWSGAQPRNFLNFLISIPGKKIFSNQNRHVFVMARKAGDKEWGGEVKIQSNRKVYSKYLFDL